MIEGDLGNQIASCNNFDRETSAMKQQRQKEIEDPFLDTTITTRMRFCEVAIALEISARVRASGNNFNESKELLLEYSPDYLRKKIDTSAR